MVGNNTASLNTGSYVNPTEYSLFISGFATDLWYGFSVKDVVEVSVWDRDNNFITWGILENSKSYTPITLSYINTLNFPVTYSYVELQSDFILYKNASILVNPLDELSSSFGLVSGSYFLTYNFTRDMAGDSDNPLIIKEISPSRKELKLIPLGESDAYYNAFCNKKVLIRDVSPLYLQLIKNCPYSQIYNQVSPHYQTQISTIMSVFHLSNDGAMVNFLKNLYEDFITYVTTPVLNFSRIQGIRTYFSNYLLQNSDTIVNFSNIDNAYNGFVSASIERKFVPIGLHPSNQYIQAKVFVYDYFTKYFYQPISYILTKAYHDKYFASLKNALNFGNNRLLPILNNGVLDERTSADDSLTLLVKLQFELPSDLAIQSSCWVSNISLTPYVVNAIVRSGAAGIVHTIGPPNFSIPISNVSLTNTNLSYTATDLQTDDQTERELTVSRNLTELNVDYTNFQNFVVFSSATARLNIFKNKMINASALSASLATLNQENDAFLIASGSFYPFYTQENSNIQNQLNNIVNSFDGYESYLYRSGNYDYVNGQFVSAGYVTSQDSVAQEYDLNNRDSLVNNCPQHISDPNSGTYSPDYLVFLSMIGHFFDNIFIYISNLPSERKIGHSTTEEFTRRIVDYMLETFGWNLDDSLEQTNLLNNYLTSEQMEGLNDMSAEDRLKAIRNRVLLNLPRIYKTKGTEESIRLILACYGIPSALLSIREYGGLNYTDNVASYTTFERTYMYQWNTSSIYDEFRVPIPPGIHSYLAKISIDDATPYIYGKDQTLFGSVPTGSTMGSPSGSGMWAVGFTRVPAKNAGKIFFKMGYNGDEKVKIYSPQFPLFDGDIYSIMVRKNLPDLGFDLDPVENHMPSTYDLYVQKNSYGNVVMQLTSSATIYDSNTHFLFNGTASNLIIGGWFAVQNGQGYTGTMDKVQVWFDPMPDNSFEDYVNNINSYAYSGSRPAEQLLIFRMHTDYPFNMRQIPPDSTHSYWMGNWKNANSFYAGPNASIKMQQYLGVFPQVDISNIKSYYPWAGTQKLVYNSSSCQYVTQSCYPFQFKVIDYPSVWTVSNYGPNKFRNEKIRFTSQSIAARFDDKERSTYIPRNDSAPDSNQVGLFADPQDFRNRDIVRFFGNYDIMGAIGDPTNQFSSSYDSLRNLRQEYAEASTDCSGSRTLFNELVTLFKLYFNRSIFESIKNVVPARANALIGVLIEPTVLERPKYQSKPIFSEMNTGSVFYTDIAASRYFHDPNTKLVRLSMSLETTRTLDLNLDYLSLPNKIYPSNYGGGYISDVPDKYQFGHFSSNGNVLFDMNIEYTPTASTSDYIFKRWGKYFIYNKTGPYNRTTNPNENLYSTNSIYLYDYVSVSKASFNSLIYTSSFISNVPAGISYDGISWNHNPYTFKNSPNLTTNKYWSIGVEIMPPPFPVYQAFIFPMSPVPNEYFEFVNGYPRNHFTHKRSIFSLFREVTFGLSGNGIYKRCSQTDSTTIGLNGLEDGSTPVQTTQVGKLNLIQSANVINS